MSLPYCFDKSTHKENESFGNTGMPPAMQTELIKKEEEKK